MVSFDLDSRLAHFEHALSFTDQTVLIQVNCGGAVD
jgi:hypothetical protein